MKLQLKKYIYLLNDITSALLSKETEDLRAQVKSLKLAIYVISALLAVSLLSNLYLAFN